MKWEIVESKLAELNSRDWVLFANQALALGEVCAQFLNYKNGVPVRGVHLGKTLSEAVLRAISAVECFESLGCVPTQEQEDDFWREHYGNADRRYAARTRQFRLMSKNMANQVDVTPDALEKFIRVSGDAVCKFCGLEWREHPEIHGMTTFHLACDGRVVKL